MKILVTGAKGFIGKNFIATLNNIRTGKDKSFKIGPTITIYEYDKNSDENVLKAYCADCDFVFHLAGVNRPQNQKEYMEGNFGLTSKLLRFLEESKNRCPIMLASSVQAELDNPYGKSKKAGEEIIFSYGKRVGAAVYVYRFPNVFGKWCRPNYNSAVATFCYNITHGLPIQINDRNTELELVYIDDLVAELISVLRGKPSLQYNGFCSVTKTHRVTLGEIVDLLYSFHKSREERSIPDMTDGSFVKKLYASFLSYLPEDQFSYPLKMNIDERGSFTEIIRTADRGQISVNISKPGIIKGDHWHHTKIEKFVVVGGKGLIQFRKVGTDKILDYYVNGEKLEVVDIPAGYTHNIINIGEDNLITLMWCNECFDPEHPDTYFLEVNEKE